ncbi:6,7-dimethyl-8-ribityllumazine synthase [Fluviispira multicolorata]|uniref:6,7-dimethyl-8-ribityllumazine synthase n=1 Tax=Fluviispira multicolorata TaxID=2654512 RepID=A0A833JF84_9BACT|nr:6,7-dimethyl-8-ribityllumazine synthase [Fluviispira multicolorata]KAB8030819.1 6,7-dimethyl-8-ribityllumazine synthase [Fluviispira multicolorata]
MIKPSEAKIGIVVARFNEVITSRLALGAKNLLIRRGVKAENIIEIEVPGAFETPLAAQLLIDNKKVQGVVALGAVIRGSTDHYNYVCSSVSSGLMNVQLTRSVPVCFGILTCDTMEQAIDRAGGKSGNKGADVADTVLEMILLRSSLLGNLSL